MRVDLNTMYDPYEGVTKASFRSRADLQEGVSGQAPLECYHETPTQAPSRIRALNYGGEDFKGEK